MISRTHPRLRSVPEYIPFSPAFQLRLRTCLPLFSSKRWGVTLVTVGHHPTRLFLPLFPWGGAVSRATYRKVTQTPHSSALEPPWLPMTSNHVHAPWPNTFHDCQPFSLCLLLPGRNPVQQHGLTPPGICTPFPLPEMPSLTGQGKAYLFSRCPGEVPCSGKPSLPSRVIL